MIIARNKFIEMLTQEEEGKNPIGAKNAVNETNDASDLLSNKDSQSDYSNSQTIQSDANKAAGL